MTRLLTKSTRYLLIILPAILFVCSAIFFFLLRRQIHHLQKEQLFLKQSNVLRRIRQGDFDPRYSVKGEYEITPVTGSLPGELNPIGDTLLPNPNRDPSELFPYRKLTTDIRWHNGAYRLTTFVSSEETKHLFLMVFVTQGLIYLILLLTILAVNRKLSAVLWKPFYRIMSNLKRYDIHRGDPFIPGGETGISEFNELSRVTSELIARNQQAYQSQKQFVENASHEIQTPLAIIRTKVELLMEQPAIDEKIAELASEISEANNRLSRLNSTLLLLTKIDNNQFIEQTDIDLSILTETLLDNFHDQYVENFPVLKKNIPSSVQITANQTLIEILLSNLIKNAIVHNLPGGYINLALTDGLLSIENTGTALDIPPEQLFERFRKGDNYAPHSYGLGLALVKHICDMYHYSIRYAYHDQVHTLEMRFR